MNLRQRVSRLERQQPATEQPGAVLDRIVAKLDGLARRLQSAPAGMASPTVGFAADDLVRVRSAVAADVAFMQRNRRGKGAR